MPKKFGKGRGWHKQQSQNRDNPERKRNFRHDEATMYYEYDSIPRISFKPSRIGKGGRGDRSDRDRMRDVETALRLHLEDDVNMSNDGRQGGRSQEVDTDERRLVHIRRRRTSPVFPKSQRQKMRRFNLAPGNWYKVTILQAARYDKNYVLRIVLAHIVPETFIPIMYGEDEDDVVFYIDETAPATKLLSADRQITTKDGCKLGIQVRPGFPQMQIDQVFKDRIKTVMAKRYVASANALDLSALHRDPDICQDFFGALFRMPIFSTVIDVVGEHTPNLRALNLEGNKFQELGRISKKLYETLPNITILYLGNNQISEWRDLDGMKRFKITELRLAGNPLCQKFKMKPDDVASEARKRFPKLLKLDGLELPPPIVFDVAEDGDGIKLPPTVRAYAVNDNARQIAATFVHQYFIIFDGDSRQPLLDAYDEHAFFSLTLLWKHDTQNKPTKYLPHNRNLFRVNDKERRHKLLKQGRLPVVSLLSELPKTKHYLSSFSMDVTLVTEVMMVVTVTGMFEEVESDKNLLRYFSRTLIIVSQGSGYCILNEQLHISEPTEAQRKQATEVPSVQSAVAKLDISGAAQEEAHLHMAMVLSQQSGMNLDWSRKCLNEVQWNFESALTAFKSFHRLGQIPPEAFEN